MHFDLTVFEDYRSGNSDAQRLINEVIDGAVSASVSAVNILQLWKDPSMDRQTEIMYASMSNLEHRRVHSIYAGHKNSE